MKLGISSYTYGWAVGTEANRAPRSLTALDLIQRAVELKVSVVQICDNLPEETYAEPSVDKIAAESSRRGVSIELGTRGCLPEHLRRFIRIARRLGSNILRVVLDSGEDRPSVDEIMCRLNAVVPDLQAHKVTLALENHDRFKAEVLSRLIIELNTPQVGICLDTANSFGALEGPDVVVDTLAQYTVNLHLKDFAVTRFPHLQGFTIEGRPAGHGMLDVPWLLGRMKALHRSPNAIIELWTPPEPSMDQTIAREAEWAEMSVRTVRQWIHE